jgi:hypothetical protein
MCPLYTSYREEPRREEKENGTEKREGKGHLLEKDVIHNLHHIEATALVISFQNKTNSRISEPAYK